MSRQAGIKCHGLAALLCATALGGPACVRLAHAQQVQPAPKASGSNTTESLVVLGRGSSRQVQTMTRTELLKATPGTSPFKTLSKLPGVVFESADALGAYEWSQQITLRGFNQNQLGYTMDGVPLGDLSYGNDNGLSIGRALQSENQGPATLAQGTGGLGLASTNNLGGTFQFTSIDPTDRYGADIAGTIGSANTWRTFGRINSGILPTGGKFVASYDYQDGAKWKGHGPQKQQQANAKLIQPLGDAVRLTLFGDWSQRRETDYQDLSLSLIDKFGYGLDNISNNYPLALDIARAYQTGGPIPAPYGTPDDVYYNAAGLRDDVLSYAKLDYNIIPHLTGWTQAYWHLDSGRGLWVTPYVPTPATLGGSPLSERTTEYDIHREGVLTSLRYDGIRHNVIEAGFWFENNDFEQARRYYALSATTAPSNFLSFPSDPFLTQWQYAFNTRTYQFHIQDTWQITPQLKANAGFKSVVVDNTARAVQLASATGFSNGSISASDGFLPQVGLVYDLDRRSEFFTDFARNMHAFTSAATGLSPFATTQPGFDAIASTLKPEYSNTYELGYRFHNASVQATVAGYYVWFDNRLIASTVGAGIVGNPVALANAGSVTSRGIETAATWRFADNWSLYGAWAYNDSHYDANVLNPDGSIQIATRDKTTVATPRNVGTFQIGYDDGAIWSNLNAQYQSRRYYTYTNDQPVRAYWLFNFDLGYRFRQPGLLKGTEAQINVTNLLDQHYVSSIGTNGFVASDPNGSFQTLQAGPPRMVFFTLKKHFF